MPDELPEAPWRRVAEDDDEDNQPVRRFNGDLARRRVEPSHPSRREGRPPERGRCDRIARPAERRRCESSSYAGDVAPDSAGERVGGVVREHAVAFGRILEEDIAVKGRWREAPASPRVRSEACRARRIRSPRDSRCPGRPLSGRWRQSLPLLANARSSLRAL